MDTIEVITRHYDTSQATVEAMLQIMDLCRENAGKNIIEQGTAIAELMERHNIPSRLRAHPRPNSIETFDSAIKIYHYECGEITVTEPTPCLVAEIHNAINAAASGALGYDTEGEYAVEAALDILEEYGEISPCKICEIRSQLVAGECDTCRC